MVKTVGETVYKYTLRNGAFFVHEGVIMEQGTRKCVYFEDKKSKARLPKDDEFGIVHADGPSLWLTDRDDELAKHIFIEYEENSIAELQELINRKTKLINVLKRLAD